ncbi:MAG TPA: hypothetical protein VFH69_05975 [Gemmatimonadota bacterium]|nr:hypothetical protein [Gemmatimonadota bacterium]
MSSGTRVVVGFALFAILVFAALEYYGTRAIARRSPDSAVVAARTAVQADNTVVGLIGGIDSFEPIDIERSDDADSARVEASVAGDRDHGRLVADLVREDGRWKIRTATFTLSDGTTIPVAGSTGR